MTLAFFAPSPVGNGRGFGKRPAAVGDAWLCLVQDLAEVASISHHFLVDAVSEQALLESTVIAPLVLSNLPQLIHPASPIVNFM